MTTSAQTATTTAVPVAVPAAMITISAREAEVDLDRTDLERTVIAVGQGLGPDLGEVKLNRITCDQRPATPASWAATVSLPALDVTLTLAGLDVLFRATAAAFHEGLGWRRTNVTMSWTASPAAGRTYGSVSMCYAFPKQEPVK